VREVNCCCEGSELFLPILYHLFESCLFSSSPALINFNQIKARLILLKGKVGYLKGLNILLHSSQNRCHLS